MQGNKKNLLVKDLELIVKVSDSELEAITGGLNPQPEPPGISSALGLNVFLQPQPLPPGIISSDLGSAVSFM